MKRVFLILPLSVLLTGCIVYSPTPTTGQYGFTYDYSVPIGEGAPVRAVSAGPAYVAEVERDIPPRVPPIYSEIPEPTPERTAIVPDTRAVVVEPSQPVIQEAAGADLAPADVTTQAAPPATAPSIVTSGGGLPFVVDDDDDTNNVGGPNIITNTNNNVGVITNTNNNVGVITNTNNNVGVITNTNNNTGVVGTNNGGATNQAFGVLPGQNVNEAAGADRTGAPDIPNRLPPAPRLSTPPTSPRANQAGTDPVSSPTPTSPLPQQNQLPQQIQQQQQQQQAPQQQQQQAPQQGGAQSQPFSPVAPQ